MSKNNGNKHITVKYIGWIPTISGRLFFDKWECSEVLRKPFYKKYTVKQVTRTKKIRRVLLSTTINWRDRKFGYDGNFKVILMTKGTVSDNEINGRVYIYPNSFSKDKKREFFSINDNLDSIAELDEKKKGIKEQYESLKNKLDLVTAPEFYIVDFVINRHGFTNVSFVFKDDITPDTPQIICRQAFYFIKYSLHYHQHHSAKDDSITEIHVDSAGAGLEMIRDLKKALVSMKRRFERTGHYCLFDAGGIVAYAKSLTRACLENKKITEKEYENENIYLENISNSLKNIAENEERIARDKDSISNSFKSLIAVFLAITAPLVILFKDEIIKGYESSNDYLFTQGIELLKNFYSNGLLNISFWILVYLGYGYIRKNSRKRGGRSIRKYLLTNVRSIIEKPTKIEKITSGFIIISLILVLIGLYRIF